VTTTGSRDCRLHVGWDTVITPTRRPSGVDGGGVFMPDDPA